MIKIFVFILVVFISLQARQNPFFPSVGEQDLLTTSNKELLTPMLKRATIELPSHARVLQKVTVTYKNLDGSIETKSIKLNKAVDWHIPLFVSQSMGDMSTKKRSKKFIHLFKSKNVDFFKNYKELKVVTKDKIIRHFLVTNPHKIVMDFKRITNLKSMFKNLNTSVFKKIHIGTHKDFYRAVIELDGKYRYNMQKISNGYLFKLR